MSLIGTDTDSVLTKSSILFHMEANHDEVSNKSYIAIYGDYTGNIQAHDIVADKSQSILGRPSIRAKYGATKGYIVLSDNNETIYQKIKDTKKYTITMRLLFSDIKANGLLYPYSVCTYNPDYHDYYFDNCEPIHEFRLEKNLFFYQTSNYSSGILSSSVMPENKWIYVMIAVDCTKHNQNRLRMYIDGKLISLGYRHEDSDITLEENLWDMAHGYQSRWEFAGALLAGAYYVSEFTIYNNCIDQKYNMFDQPTKSTHELFNLTTVNKIEIEQETVATSPIDIYPLPNGSPDDGVFIVERYDESIKDNIPIPTEFQRSMNKIVFIGDEWCSGSWTTKVAYDLGLVLLGSKSIVNGTTNDVKDQFKTEVLDKKPDLVVIIAGLHDDYPYKAFVNLKQLAEEAYRSNTIPIIASYTRVGDSKSEKRIWDLNLLLTDYWYGSDRPPLVYYVNNYYRNNLSYYEAMDNYSDINHLNDTGKAIYGEMISLIIKEAIRHMTHYDYPKLGRCSIQTRVILEADEFQTDFESQIEVDEPPAPEVANLDTPLELTIPYPYPALKDDTPFFLVAPDGRFIAEYFYNVRSDGTIRFKNGKNPFNIGLDEQVQFVFIHKHGFYAVKKIEQTIETTANKYTYHFDSPYNEVVDLNQRVKVHYNGNILPPNEGFYEFDNISGDVTFNNTLEMGGTNIITFLCFYTATQHNDKAIPSLPMSGYIEFSKKYADRVWDKNLFAVFVNGKLVPKESIIDISSNTHKIIKDIRSRYNIEVLNMSPSIGYMSPFLLYKYSKINNDKTCIHDFISSCEVYYPKVLKPRPYIEPTVFSPAIEFDQSCVAYEFISSCNVNVLEDQDSTDDPHALSPIYYSINNKCYVSLIHRGNSNMQKNQDVEYTLSFHEDPYYTFEDSDSKISILAQLRLTGNEHDYDTFDTDVALIGEIPPVLTNVENDEVLFSTLIDDIWTKYLSGLPEDADNSNYRINGIEVRLKIKEEFLTEAPEDRLPSSWKKLYYDLEANNYEHGSQIGVLKWVISDQENGQGNIYYQKTLFLVVSSPVFVDPD